MVLRVSKNVEIRGLDIQKHGEPAYPTSAQGHGWDKEGRESVLNDQDILEGLLGTY